MKERNIKLFKQFLEFRGLDKMFKGLYKQHRFPDNPENFEEYLQKVDSFYVIHEAFDYNQMKSAGSFDGKFWSSLSKKWIDYMKSMAARGYYQDEILIPRVPVKNADGSIHEAPKADEPHEVQIEDDAPSFIERDWSGLNLVPLKSVTKRQMEPPAPLEMRVCTASGNVVVLSTHISTPLEQFGLMTMEMQVDRGTNQLVFVFGKGLQFNVNAYSTNIYAIQHKTVIEYLQKYLDVKFDTKKVYYVKVREKIWNKDHSRCAVVVTTTYREVDR